mmetsp:Transcript_81370/g.225313  ORF Transcript_81370/g.225313 Transcript_81370/m.225313 type:complete len:274 (-) Transcript_81370:201-1022(-)
MKLRSFRSCASASSIQASSSATASGVTPRVRWSLRACRVESRGVQSALPTSSSQPWMASSCWGTSCAAPFGSAARASPTAELSSSTAPMASYTGSDFSTLCSLYRLVQPASPFLVYSVDLGTSDRAVRLAGTLRCPHGQCRQPLPQHGRERRYSEVKTSWPLAGSTYVSRPRLQASLCSARTAAWPSNPWPPCPKSAKDNGPLSKASCRPALVVAEALREGAVSSRGAAAPGLPGPTPSLGAARATRAAGNPRKSRASPAAKPQAAQRPPAAA